MSVDVLTSAQARVWRRQDMIRLLTAMGDPTRLELLTLLNHHGRQNVGSLAALLPRVSRPAISHHLRVLKDAGVVGYEKLGQEGFYWVDRSRVAEGLRAMADMVDSGTCESS
jgi:ArsR family transcriptional regulator, arsenate/arsenite/antimonite-responsive transcriptional repressor